MVKKILGYILFIAGLAGVALSFSVIRTPLKITIPAPLTELTLMVAGIVLLLIGAFLSFGGRGSGGQKAAEVPIYQGKNIIGYRKV